MKRTTLENADIQIIGKAVLVVTRPAGEPIRNIWRPCDGQTVDQLYRQLIREHTNEDGE